jgi:hypothetical protein
MPLKWTAEEGDASGGEDLEEAAGMPLKWTAEEGDASGGEDLEETAGMPLKWTAEEGNASGGEDLEETAGMPLKWTAEEGAPGGEDFGGGIASAEEDFRAVSNEEEGLWKAVSLMMASLDVVVASDEGEGFRMIAAAKAGLGFCASSEEEGFVEALMKMAEVGAATMAGLGMVAAAKAGFGFFASSEEEGLTRATGMKGEVGAAMKAGFEETAVSSMGASTAVVMAGLVGAAAAVADSQ